jgi:T-complex protein 1 subunit theta
VPRVLAESAGLPASNVISALSAAHAAGKSSAGIDCDGDSVTGILADAAAAGIRDSVAVKLSALRLASEVAITILRVDNIIMAKAAGGPKPRAAGPQDGGDD